MDFAPGDLVPYARDTFNDVPDAYFYIEAVHRLSELGAVVTHVIEETSRDGFDAEWRAIALCVYHGELLSRFEVFDEAHLATALARFEELAP